VAGRVHGGPGHRTKSFGGHTRIGATSAQRRLAGSGSGARAQPRNAGRPAAAPALRSTCRCRCGRLAL
jgi:hypothetical protein